MSESFPFLKGHGTENDFVLLPDLDGTVHGDLDPALVAALCDRRAGIGGDGVLRVVRTDAYDDPAAIAARGTAEWFMDYRNSDGSSSQMCGNGVRVFGRYLADHLGVDTTIPLPVGTRAGVKTLTFEDDGTITADMGTARVFDDTKVNVGDRSWPAVHVNMGNPHAVAFLDDLAEAGPLLVSPAFDESVYPEGVNVEFVVRRGPRHLAMRVFERGSGETRSCGTGACAVMVAGAIADNVAARQEFPDGSAGTPGAGTPGAGIPSAGRPAAGGAWRVEEDVTYRVDVPGGQLAVTWTRAGRVLLTGPAVIVAEGRIENSLARGR